MRITVIGASIILGLFIQSVRGWAVTTSTFLSARPKSEVVKPIDKASYFRLDKAAFLRLLRTQTHIELSDFPSSSGERFTLELKPAHSAINASTACIVTTPDGEKSFKPAPQICFRGVVEGQEHSNVFLSASDDLILLSIKLAGGTTLIFGPDRNSSNDSDYILISENDLLSSAPFTPFECINDRLTQPHELRLIDEVLSEARGAKSRDAVLNNGKLLQLDVAVEADSQFYGATGGDAAKSIAYIGALFSMSSVVYEDEANITHHLTWIKVWTTSDPYQVHGNAYALPDTVRSYWQKNYAAVPRDVAHVMTSISYGGGGYGYFSLCDPAYSYSVSSMQTGHTYPTFAWTYDVYTVSHEIGHNFSLPHTHTCWWNPPLDTCYTNDDANLKQSDACYGKPITPRRSPGTIMSYCQNANYSISGDFSQYKVEMTFSHRPDSVMRVSAEAAACVMPPTVPTLILLSPRGTESYLGGATIPLKWTYANVQNVSLEFSTDGGISWSPIISNIAASLATTQWKLPNIESSKMLVRIFDPSQQQTGDTSLLFFSLAKNGVSRHEDVDEFILAPNPAHDHISLRSSIVTGPISGAIFDELGIVRRQFKLTDAFNNEASIDLHGLTAGKYFMHIHGESGSESILSFVVE